MKIFLSNNSNKFLYLPIEIFTREFHSKIYLAHEAVQKGWTVLVGPKYDINPMMKYLPSGIYSGIGFHKSAAKLAKKIKSFGHKVFSQDEEGLVRLSPEFYKEYRVDENIFDNSDLIFCWGKRHQEIMEAIFKKSSKIRSIGNGRVDILSSKLKKIFEKDAELIKKENGNFILINGNFGSANHFSGKENFLKELESRGWLDTEQKKEYQLNRIEFQNSIFLKMMSLSVEIAKTGKKIIVRPHPSENLNKWKEFVSDYTDNIKIIRSGNVIPWIMASNYLIHNGCTTAIEAVLMGKDVISFRPFKNKSVESILPNAISSCMETQESVLNYLKNDKNKYSLNDEALKILNDNIEQNFQHEDATSRIINMIEKLEIKKSRPTFLSNLLNEILFRLNLLKMKISRKIYNSNFQYELIKCPPLANTEVTKLLTEIADIKSEDKNFEVCNFNKHSIIIQPKNN